MSCGTIGSVTSSGNAKPAINPSEVNIYASAPPNYETMGLVEAICGGAATCNLFMINWKKN